VNVKYKIVNGTYSYSTTETKENIKEKYEAGFMIFAKIKGISADADHIYTLIMYTNERILSFSRPAYDTMAATTERLDFSWDTNNSVYKITYATKE
jgi:glutathione peroxidase-family protein